jgi:glycosyltransferase involved in cell wall biosynthesis
VTAAGPRVVSVVVPTHHRPERLEHAVASALEQALPDGWETEVVVALSDPAWEPDRAAAARLAVDPRVVVTSSVTPGPAAARNSGIRASRGEVVAMLDDDCTARPGWLAAGLAALANADLVQGRTLPTGPVGATDHTLSVSPPSWLWESCNLMVRRELIEQAGLFDEHFTHPQAKPHFGEDAEWGWRLVRSGARAAFVPEAVVEHAVERQSLNSYLRYHAKARWFPWLFRQVPEARRHFYLGYFVNRRHAVMVGSVGLFGLAGVSSVTGHPRAAKTMAMGGVVGWLSPARGDLLDIAQEVAVRTLVEGVQYASVVYGSLRWRRILL